MFNLLLKQILQLKLQIEEKINQNKKLKANLIGLQEDIEKVVSIVTKVLKHLNNLGDFFFCLCVLIVHLVEHGT